MKRLPKGSLQLQHVGAPVHASIIVCSQVVKREVFAFPLYWGNLYLKEAACFMSLAYFTP